MLLFPQYRLDSQNEIEISPFYLLSTQSTYAQLMLHFKVRNKKEFSTLKLIFIE